VTRFGDGCLSQAVCKVTHWSDGEHGEVSRKGDADRKHCLLMRDNYQGLHTDE